MINKQDLDRWLTTEPEYPEHEFLACAEGVCTPLFCRCSCHEDMTDWERGFAAGVASERRRWENDKD